MLARGAAPWILPAALALAGALALDATGHRLAAELIGYPSLVAFAVLFFFFRDPERRVAKAIVSPSDGRVLESAGNRISVFLAPWSVHVIRAPESALIESSTYRRGGHRPAFDKASASNERLALRFSTATGPMEVTLIAGSLARRIHPYVGAGDRVRKGERIGLIAFGSRCDLRLPPGHVSIVRPGQRVRAASTTVGLPEDGVP